MGRKVTIQTQSKIVSLRQEGNSITEISSQLHLPKTTVFHYIKGVDIFPEFTTLWKIKRGGSTKRKLLAEISAKNEAKKIVDSLSEKERIIFLCALYWAEGSKGDFGLSNTDPFLVKVFIEILKNTFKIPVERFRVSIRIYEDLDADACLGFWAKITGIPKKEFVSVNVIKGKKIGKLQYGMCRIRILKGGTILKKIKAINTRVYEVIQSP